MSATIIIAGALYTPCPACDGEGYTEALDAAHVHRTTESPPYRRVACADCADEPGWVPATCEECGEHLDGDGSCAACLDFEARRVADGVAA